MEEREEGRNGEREREEREEKEGEVSTFSIPLTGFFCNVLFCHKHKAILNAKAYASTYSLKYRKKKKKKKETIQNLQIKKK